VRYDPAAPGQMSPDPEWHGFRRLGSELSLAPSHVEKYLQAARQVLDAAFPEREVAPRTWRKDALDIDWSNRAKRELLREMGLEDQVRTLIWPDHRLSFAEPTHARDPLAPGTYRARMQLSGLAPPGGRPPHVTLYSQQLDRTLFRQDILAPEDEPVVVEFEAYFSGPVGVQINNEVPGPSNSGRAGRPTSQYVFTRLDNPDSRAPWQRKMTDEEGNALHPFLIFDWIEWEGPIVTPEDAAKREPFRPPPEGDREAMREGLERFASRAWRRPATEAEVERHLAVLEGELAAGEAMLPAWKTALSGILASMHFYYLAEGSPDEVRENLDAWELASRLSYFLWSSLPDEELLAAAASGALLERETLRAQFERMTVDPKIERFAESFPFQWFQLGQVGTFPPDERLYPDYDGWLEQSMVLETTGFFAEVFRRNLPVREFLDSDWTVLNPRLARHYGMNPPAETGFQRVALEPGDRRGGVLTQASVLSLSSDGTRHRPVHRGVWVSEAIFGRSPSPPPPNVDAIEPTPLDEPKASVRRQLEAHTTHASCASCHQRIDPLGLAFDHYDAIGRWREVEHVPTGRGPDPPVDASGELPGGRRFGGPEEFKGLLVEDADRFAGTVAEKLAIYALRRAMTVDDREPVRAVADAAAGDGHRMRDLVEALVLSDLFLKR